LRGWSFSAAGRPEGKWSSLQYKSSNVMLVMAESRLASDPQNERKSHTAKQT
jgi:hypothetical protein